MPIDDPLARFLDEEDSREAGVKNPVTGLRESHDTAERQRRRDAELKRKSSAAKRVVSGLMADPLGREWLYDQLVTCNVFGTPFSADPIATAYNAGALFYGRGLEGELKRHALKEYLLMLEEGMVRQRIWDDEA